jgi:hypothetical protein
MTATLTQVVKQCQQDWTGQLEPEAILMAGRGVAYRWRERPLTVFERLLRSVSHALQHSPLEEGRGVGHCTFWVDGSSCSIPATPALQEHFGQPGKQLPGCGFPVAHLLALFHAGTGMV